MRKNKHFQSLASRLSLWIISLGTLIFIAVLSTNYFLSRLLLEDYVEDLAKTTSSSTVRKIETIFNTVSANADSLAAVISTSDLSEKQIHQIINAFLKTNTAIYGMTVALEPNTLSNTPGDFSPYYYRKDNGITFSDLADSNYQYKNWAWYTEAKKLNSAIWSDPYLDEGGGNVLMTTYSTPIYLSDNKTFAGIATADIRLSWLDEIVKEIEIGESGFGFILSKNDVVIAHPDKSINLTPLDKKKVRADNWQKYMESKSLERKSGASAVYFKSPCSKRAGDCWFAIKTLGNTEWKVVIVLPEQELISRINSLTVKISIIAVTGLLILLFVVIFISRHLTSPLAKLATATQDIGAGYLDTELPEAARKDEIGALTDDFSSMRDALKNYIAEIQETTAKQQKLESEIQIAKDIQMSMLPGSGKTFVQNKSYQLFAFLRPARSVGGDLYYFQQTDDELHFIIGDVSDKGVPAALFMAKTVTLYTRALKDELPPGQTFTMMNDILAQNNDACMFVTALCGSINLATGSIVMSNAGHMDPIIKQDQLTNEHEVKGATALGLMEGLDYPDIEFQLNNNSSLIMYTDGISEAHDTNNNQYTDEKLLEFISDLEPVNAEETGKRIIDSTDTFAAGTEQFDDITLLVIHYEQIVTNKPK
ncbi:MAG: SpoIIE family protein phosphatase [Gammaproteobacteria bacterium]|nr:SpoIIE family protein phosphatase [Gammaproteobacteria bacterium]